MTAGPRLHLRTEAAEEAAELVAAISVHRPGWVRPFPRRLVWVRELDDFWTRKLPRQAKYEPDLLGRAFAMHEQTYREEAIIDHLVRVQRDEQAGMRRHARRLDLRNLYATPVGDPEGDAWLGLPPDGRVEEWRIAGAFYFWGQILLEPTYGGRRGRTDTSVADWLDPYVDLELIRTERRSYNVMWFSEVAPSELRLQWIRWTFHRAQAEFKVGRGNPMDEQQAAYLPTCDVYLTGDKRFQMAIDRVAAVAPFSFGRAIYVKQTSGSAVAEIDRAISKLPES